MTILERHDDGQLAAVSHHGDRRLGGADFDRLIVGRMAEFAMRTYGVMLDADPVDLAEALRQGRADQEGPEQPGAGPGGVDRRAASG